MQSFRIRAFRPGGARLQRRRARRGWGLSAGKTGRNRWCPSNGHRHGGQQRRVVEDVRDQVDLIGPRRAAVRCHGMASRHQARRSRRRYRAARRTAPVPVFESRPIAAMWATLMAGARYRTQRCLTERLRSPVIFSVADRIIPMRQEETQDEEITVRSCRCVAAVGHSHGGFGGG